MFLSSTDINYNVNARKEKDFEADAEQAKMKDELWGSSSLTRRSDARGNT